MWRFAGVSGPLALKVPKRMPEDPTELFSVWKRRRDGEDVAARESQQVQMSDALPSGSLALKVPKRLPEDPTELFSVWKRRRDGEDVAARESQQVQMSDALPVQDEGEDDRAAAAPVEDWLFSAEFNDRIESTSDTPFDQELDELADLPSPAPEKEGGEKEVADTLTTVKNIQQELAAAEQGESAGEYAEEPTLPVSNLLENLPPPEVQEDVGFEEPDEQVAGGPSVQDAEAGFDIPPRAAEPDDPSEPIHHTPKPFQTSSFLFAFALWEKKHNISRAAHSHLLEVLRLATSLEEFQRIPQRKDTLARQMRNVLPLSTLRQSTVKLDQEVVTSNV